MSLFVNPTLQQGQQDIFGIALSSPGLCSPGLCGKQGWSPCSSVYSDGDVEDDGFGVDAYMANKRGIKASMNSLLAHKRHTMVWPMPPARIPITRPLSFHKQQTTLRSPAAESTSSSSSSSVSDHSSAITIPDGGYAGTDASMMFESPRKGMKHAMAAKRFFSAPAPPLVHELANGDLVEVLDDKFDESLPLMPLSTMEFEREWDDEEEVKMARLQASMSLLGVQSGPRVGHYTENNASMTSPSSVNSVRSPIGEEENSPTAGLCLLRMALSPEHKAPTLQEQMAFASGLGNMCSWASPMKMAYASSDGYLANMARRREGFHSQAHPTLVEKDETDGPTYEDEEQGQDDHVILHPDDDEVYEQNTSAYSPFAFERRLAPASNDISRISIEEEEGKDETYARCSSPLERSISRHSCAASTVISAGSSPIMHGALSASVFDHSIYVSVPQTVSMPAQSDDTNASPALAHDEYSYLAQDDAFFLAMQGSPQPVVCQQSSSSSSSSKSAWPDVNGFNGNTMSPCITTPELNLAGTPCSMHLAPSPCMLEQSVQPSADLCRPPVDDEQPRRGIDAPFAFSLPPQSYPMSSLQEQVTLHPVSLASVLERPRPIPTSRSASFFARSDDDVLGQHRSRSTISVSTTAAANKQKGTRTSSVSMTETQKEAHPSPCLIPTRGVSLACPAQQAPPAAATTSVPDAPPSTAQRPPPSLPKSVSFKDEPHPRHLLLFTSPSALTDEGRMTTSSSMGSLRPKALAQVREACRLKTVYLRDGQSLATPNVSADKADVVPPVPPMPTTVSSAKVASFTMEEKEKKQEKKVARKPVVASHHPPTSSPSSSSSAAASEQQPVAQRRPRRRTSSERLPTLYVARTPSQRKKGLTGIPATEPSNIAMAKMGMRVTMPVRSSTVQALAAGQSWQQQQRHRKRNKFSLPSSRTSSLSLQTSFEPSIDDDVSEEADEADGTYVDPALAVAAELQSSLSGMPDGFVLIVEETQTVESTVYVPCPLS